MALGDKDNWESEGRQVRYPSSGRGEPVVIRDRAVARPRDEWEDDDSDQGFQLDLLAYWRVLLKHRYAIVAVVAAFLVIGAAVTIMTQPIYSASATMQLDREAARVLNTQTVETGESMIAGEEFFQTQYGLLKSRSLAIRVVDSLGLAGNDKFLEQMGVDVDFKRPANGEAGPTVEEQRRLAVIKTFQDNLSVSPVRGSRLVIVTFDSPDPVLAARIANAVADNFIDSNLDRRFDASAAARDFLEKRLAQVKTRLEDSERQVVAYATNEQIINIPAGNSADGSSQANQSLTASSLVQQNAMLAGARGERIRAEQRWRQSISASGAGLPEVLQSPTIQELNQTKAKIEAEYQDKLRIYKPEFPEMMQLRARADEINAQIQTEIRNVRNSLKTQYDIAAAQERSFEGQVSELKSSVLDLRGRSIQYDILQREVDTNRTLYDGLLQRYKEIGVAGGVTSNNISVVDRAEPPQRPARPKPFANMVVALLIGLGAGMLGAFLIELFDESIRTPEDAESKLGLALLGSVPVLERGRSVLEALADPRSPFSESYHSIRTALQFSTAEGVPSTLLVTSARPSEGKSTTAMALARTFSRLGMKTLLMDGDLRNPSMHKNLSADNAVGMSNVLTRHATVEQVVQATDLPNLFFIACGPLPPNPAELLSGSSFDALLNQAKAMYDLVIIDGPPVLGLADAPMLAASTAGTIFVIESGGTRRGLARSAIRRLQLGHARLLGTVLTKFDAKKASYGYGAGYAYAYEYNYGSKRQID